MRRLLILILAAVAGVLVLMLHGAVANVRLVLRGDAVEDKFRSLGEALRKYRDSNSDSSFPRRLSGLIGKGVSTDDFLCAGTRTRAGSLADVDRWADYIYVVKARKAEGTDAYPILISPPCDHFGRRGYFSLASELGGTLALWREDFDQMMKRLYSDTNVEIIVSQTLEKRSRGLYKSCLRRPGG